MIKSILLQTTNFLVHHEENNPHINANKSFISIVREWARKTLSAIVDIKIIIYKSNQIANACFFLAQRFIDMLNHAC